MGGIGAPEKLIVKGKRLDGRKPEELRPIHIEAGVIENADGSCFLKIGETEVFVAVYGPREMFPRRLQEADRAHLNCIYSMMPFATPDRNRPGPSRRSKEISMVMASALAPAIFLEKYPKTGIDVYAIVSNANAGTRCAAITAAAVALADAGIQMKDLVVSVAAGKVDDTVVLDLYNPEDNFGQADMPLAIMPRTKEITLLQMDGDLSKDEIKNCMDMIMKASEEIYKIQRDALKRKYHIEQGSKEEVEE